ncbi:unnamed protein product [Candidula unifasciata]|uniref:Uncharacterized protein n=1 Tax=Candidula unifasciata TaxID=100452 RepID=A0A8S3ZND8_9EUPU|nr:unnamed protein product [Candidula unifasciata]
MEYPLPGPVVALLQQENASMVPKSYFISSDKKSIKITLVYAKADQPADPVTTSLADRKKTRYGPSGKPSSKPSLRRTRSKVLSESSTSTSNEQTDNVSHSETDQLCVSPELPIHTDRKRDGERMSTADSGHPSSFGVATNEHDTLSEFDSEVGDEGDESGCDSISSLRSEKPRTPCSEMAVPASSIGPGETPAATRDEMWQTWTRIPRTQISSRSLISTPLSTVRRSMSPSVAFVQRTIPAAVTLRRPRLHEGVSWDGSGSL